MNRLFAASLTLVPVALLTMACGGAVAEPAIVPPTVLADPNPDNADLRALDRAEAELVQELGSLVHDETPRAPSLPLPEGSPSHLAPAAAGSWTMAASPSSSAQPRADRARPGQSAVSRSAPNDHPAPRAAAMPCGTACAALASMVRAADHLCRLAGAEDARCQSAQARVKRATERVYTTCPTCVR